MKTLIFDDREQWLAARRGKITGSRLGNIVVKRGTGRKIGFYELIAERIATEPDKGETPMDRGTRLESEAIKKFEEETGKKVDTSLVIWTRDDNESIAISPDGFISDSEALVIASTGTREAVECKCLSSAKHIEAWFTQSVPGEYEFQVLQYFIVNDKLQKLYFCFYDPRIPAKSFFYIEFTREEKQAEIDQYLEYQKQVLEEVNNIVNDLTF